MALYGRMLGDEVGVHVPKVEKALSSLNRKVRQVDLTEAVPVMQQHYDAIDKLFMSFFTRLKEACDSKFFKNGQ